MTQLGTEGSTVNEYVSSFKLIHCSQHGDGKLLVVQNLCVSCP